MNSRERVIRAIEFRRPDRLPIFYGLLPSAFLAHGQALRDLLSEFPNDFGVDPQAVCRELDQRHSPGTYTDEWGTTWQVEQAGMIGIVKGVPLESWDDLAHYELPPQPTVGSRPESPDSRSHYAFGWGITFFERLQQLRGFENLMVDLASGEPRLHELMDRIVDWYLDGVGPFLGPNSDGVHFADDWGTQRALMISPASWDAWFKPRYARMFKPAKDAGKHVWFHTDGYTLPIFESLKEIGCDVVNPQHTIIGVHEIGSRFAGRLAFRTDFDRQHILPHGTRQQIRDHVKETIDALATPEGGVILHGEIAGDVPLSNIRWMLEACVEFGRL